MTTMIKHRNQERCNETRGKGQAMQESGNHNPPGGREDRDSGQAGMVTAVAAWLGVAVGIALMALSVWTLMLTTAS
jgi:hypothetical protein